MDAGERRGVSLNFDPMGDIVVAGGPVFEVYGPAATDLRAEAVLDIDMAGNYHPAFIHLNGLGRG